MPQLNLALLKFQSNQRDPRQPVPCPWEEVEWLSSIQVWNGGLALSLIEDDSEAKAEKELSEIARKIKGVKSPFLNPAKQLP